MKTIPEKFRAWARIMKALSSEVRLMIVDELSRGERCMCELQPLFTMNKSTLSRHIAELKNAGILHERRDGVRTYLKLATPCILNVFECTMSVIRTETRRRAKIERS
jgi:ArsR family transcriptional regulator